MMGDALICFSCCIAEQPQPKKTRRRIDATMIGLPTEFRHTGHIGSGEVATNKSITLDSMQTQMSSKGGYENVSTVDVHLDVIDLPNNTQSNR